MNIIDAVKSGKPFRRVGAGQWVLTADAAKGVTLNTASLAANDWETQEDRVMVTKEQFMEKAAEGGFDEKAAIELAKKLGLE